VLACYTLSLFSQTLGPSHPGPDGTVASWLKAHHLTYGLSTSWFGSNGVTLYGQDRVRVRDVTISANGEPVRLRWNTQASWYSPRLHDARFVVLNPCAQTTTEAKRLIDALGPPAAIHFVRIFTILVWKTNLLTSHRGPVPQPSRERARIARQRALLVLADHVRWKSLAYRLTCG
jgi:hypothetical protein